MTRRRARTLLGLPCALVALAIAPRGARAAPDVVLEGEVTAADPDYVHVPFTVPAGIVELELAHPRLDDDSVLDWGLLDPSGFRGWGGGNTEPIVVGETSASRSYLPGPITAGEWRVIVGKALVDAAAPYRIEVTFRTEATLANAARTAWRAPAPLATGPRWFAGDLHVHSRESGDARADLDAIATFAEGRGLDFVVITDHNTHAQVELLADVQARHPRVLLVPGVELTTYAGHANGLGATTWIDHRVGHDGRTMAEVARDVRAQSGLFSINHPMIDVGALCIGCGWAHDVPVELVDAVEIATGGWSRGGYVFGREAITFWDRLVARGARAAAIGGSDDHTAGVADGAFQSPIGSPTTMVYARELSVDAILAGVRAMRTVVKLEGPDDPMIELDAPDGGIVEADDARLTATITGAPVGALARWVVDGRVAETTTVTASPVVLSREVDARPDRETRVRVELWIDDAPRVITSHVFVRAPAGCACTSARDADDGAHAGGLASALCLCAIGLVTRRVRSRR